ncbi:30S ribosomal protein S20 [Candidatus Blochmanniella vafra str. BVAF]|uniref:Small ribosomal subunit protein bS20 n=1 Tax=Blochmanniella vafra (strain BVAF) TaxID=859654 RepID=E8Q5M7_BLOVB|nr:30S ribosomal protein S20 [Candidatus Blochmannia vafer]ADV33524.1 30S ribosomal protein S20 [Candidatus Blochmannia vafer str. BVAF]
MANIKSSKKSIKKSKNRRTNNISKKSMLRTFIKKVKKAINNKNKALAINQFIIMQKCIDRQSTKGLIHRNKAARYKSKIFKQIKTLTP